MFENFPDLKIDIICTLKKFLKILKIIPPYPNFRKRIIGYKLWNKIQKVLHFLYVIDIFSSNNNKAIYIVKINSTRNYHSL